MSKVKITGNASGTGTLTIAAPNTNVDRTLDIPDAAGDLVVAEGGTFKIDSSGNVGIGTSSPSVKLDLTSGATGESSNAIRLGYGRSAHPTDAIHQIRAASDNLYIQADTANTIASNIIFQNDGTERMRIDSSGSIIQSTTGSYSNSADTLRIDVPNQAGILMGTNTTTNVYRMRYYVGGAKVGQITTSGSTTTYTTSSDYRLKTDVQPMTGATERLKALKPVNFEWISDGTRVDGFLAHEAQEVVPEAVTGTKDAMTTEEYEVTPAVLDDDGNVVTEAVMGEREVPDYQGIDQSKLVPLLVATIQELEARIAALESN